VIFGKAGILRINLCLCNFKLE